MGLSPSIPSSLAGHLARIANTVKNTASGLLKGIPFFKTKTQSPAIPLAMHESDARKKEARRQGVMLAQAPDPEREAMLQNLPVGENELDLASSFLFRPSAINIAKPIPANIREIIERMTNLKDTWITKMGVEPEALEKLKNKLGNKDLSLAGLVPDLGLLKQIAAFYSRALEGSQAPALA